MTTSMHATLLTCTLQVQVPNPLILPYEWSYPLDIRSSCRIEYLATADVVALVRATVGTAPLRRALDGLGPVKSWSRSTIGLTHLKCSTARSVV